MAYPVSIITHDDLMQEGGLGCHVANYSAVRQFLGLPEPHTYDAQGNHIPAPRPSRPELYSRQMRRQQQQAEDAERNQAHQHRLERMAQEDTAAIQVAHTRVVAPQAEWPISRTEAFQDAIRARLAALQANRVRLMNGEPDSRFSGRALSASQPGQAMDINLPSAANERAQRMFYEGERPAAVAAADVPTRVETKLPAGLKDTEAPDDTPESQVCIVCKVNLRQVTLVPCGHRSMCITCVNKIVADPNPKCPSCRAIPSMVIRTIDS